MIQATTPPAVLILPDTVDLTTVRDVYATFRQKKVGNAQTITITKTLADGLRLEDGHTLIVSWTQSETLQFLPGRPLEMQVNWITAGGIREATLIATTYVGENLIPEVISGGD